MPLSDSQIAVIVREAAKNSAIQRDGSTTQRIARAIESAVAAPLLAQIAALEAERERNLDSIRVNNAIHEKNAARIAQLEAQLAEARKDAERYRHATQKPFKKFALCVYRDGYWMACTSNSEIDAAIAQEQPAIQPAQQEQPRHLWDGSPWPNYVVTLEENTTNEGREAFPSI